MSAVDATTLMILLRCELVMQLAKDIRDGVVVIAAPRVLLALPNQRHVPQPTGRHDSPGTSESAFYVEFVDTTAL